MNFWDKIKNWLRPSEQISKQLPSASNEDGLNQVQLPDNTPQIGTTAAPSDHPDDINPADDIPVDVFQILFSHKNKHATTMLNSISLSSDMKTLYLIDNGKPIAYDLTVPEGVIVGLLGDQLVVATAVSPPAPDTTELETTSDETVMLRSDDSETERRERPEKVSFKATKDSQYALTYNGEHQTLGIIGFDDIDLGLETPDGIDDKICKEQRYKMKNNKFVRLIFENEILQIFQENI